MASEDGGDVCLPDCYPSLDELAESGAVETIKRFLRTSKTENLNGPKEAGVRSVFKKWKKQWKEDILKLKLQASRPYSLVEHELVPVKIREENKPKRPEPYKLEFIAQILRQ